MSHIKGHISHTKDGKQFFVHEYDDKRHAKISDIADALKKKTQELLVELGGGKSVEKSSSSGAVSYKPSFHLFAGDITKVKKMASVLGISFDEARTKFIKNLEAKKLYVSQQGMTPTVKKVSASSPSKPTQKSSSAYQKSPEPPEGHYWGWDREKNKSILKEKPQAYGGVVFNDKGQVLLRKPTGGFGGYAHTWPKGRQDKGDTPEETALREVLEETGTRGAIVAKIPKNFEGSVTNNGFYIMKVVEEGLTDEMDDETEDVAWADPDEAVFLIKKTQIETGRKRDLDILVEALKLKAKLESEGKW